MPIRKRSRRNREEWLAWRKENINASEAGALLGVDKHRSRLTLYYEKTGVVESAETNAMRRGRWLEPAVIAATREMRPDWKIETVNNYYDDPDLRIGASPDAFFWMPGEKKHGVLQAKTVDYHELANWRDDEEGDVRIPIPYQLQTGVVEAKLTGAAYAAVATLVVGRFMDLIVLPVAWHEESWHAIKTRTREFWELVKRREAPPVSPAVDAHLIKKLYPVDDGSELDLSSDNELPGLISQHQALKEALKPKRKRLKPMEDALDNIKTLIRAKMGDAKVAYAHGFELRLPTTERSASVSRTLYIKDLSKDD